MTRETIVCENKRPHLGPPCRTVLGELINGRLEVRRLGLVAFNGTIMLTCKNCGGARLFDLDAPVPPLRLDSATA